jgi:hypothetical protein
MLFRYSRRKLSIALLDCQPRDLDDTENSSRRSWRLDLEDLQIANWAAHNYSTSVGVSKIGYAE